MSQTQVLISWKAIEKKFLRKSFFLLIRSLIDKNRNDIFQALKEIVNYGVVFSEGMFQRSIIISDCQDK